MSEEATRKAERNSLTKSRDWRTIVARRDGGFGYIDRDTTERIPRDTVSDERRELMAAAREWSRIVAADSDLRREHFAEGLHYVDSLAEALEDSLGRERRLTDAVNELEELRKAAKSVLLANAAGRKPEVHQWTRLENALEER